jgi:hypothetical protein
MNLNEQLYKTRPGTTNIDALSTLPTLLPVSILTLLHTCVHTYTFHGSKILSQRQYNVEKVINTQLYAIFTV